MDITRADLRVCRWLLAGLFCALHVSPAVGQENLSPVITMTGGANLGNSPASGGQTTIGGSTTHFHDRALHVSGAGHVDVNIHNDTGAAAVFGISYETVAGGDDDSFIKKNTTTVANGVTVLDGAQQHVGFTYPLKYLWDAYGSGVSEPLANPANLQFSLQVDLWMNNAIVDTAVIVYTLNGAPGEGYTAAGGEGEVEFNIGQQHSPPGSTITVDHELWNHLVSPALYVIGYDDTELGDFVMLHSVTLPVGYSKLDIDLFDVPNYELYSRLDLIVPVLEHGEITFPVTGDGTWIAGMSWGDTKTVSVSGVYRVMQPVAGTFDVLSGVQVAHTVTLVDDPVVDVPAFNAIIGGGDHLGFDFKNLLVDNVKWYGMEEASGEMVETQFPGFEYLGAGVYFFDVTILGIAEAGANVETGTSAVTETKRSVVKNGVLSFETVRTANVTRGDGTTYTTVHDTGSGQQLTGDSDTPLGPGTTRADAYIIGQLDEMSEDLDRVRQLKEEEAEFAKTEGESGKDYLGSYDANQALNDSKALFGETPMGVGDLLPMLAPASGWEYTMPNVATFNLDPAQSTLQTEAANFIKAVLTALISGLFFWWVLNELHNFDRALAGVPQLSIFNQTILGNTVSAPFIPLFIAFAVAAFAAAPTLLSAYVGLHDGQSAEAVNAFTQTGASFGEIGAKVSYLLNFYLPMSHILVTIGNLFGFVLLRNWVYKIYSWVKQLLIKN